MRGYSFRKGQPPAARISISSSLLQGVDYQSCIDYGQGTDRVDYVKGANIAAFVKLADAITAYGIMWGGSR
jgi:hypothetical protein